MGHLTVWKVLEEMIADFRERKTAVPQNVMDDLKSAKTLLNISKAETNREEKLLLIDIYLENVESYLVSEGEKLFGTAYAEEWLKKLQEARKEIDEEEEEMRFIPGLPREQKWVRVKLTPEWSVEKLVDLAGKVGLLYKLQKEDSLLVYGEDKQVKDFIKKMTTKHNAKGGK